MNQASDDLRELLRGIKNPEAKFELLRPVLMESLTKTIGHTEADANAAIRGFFIKDASQASVAH